MLGDGNEKLWKVLITVDLATEHEHDFDRAFMEKHLGRAVCSTVETALFQAGYRGMSQMHGVCDVVVDEEE